MLSYANGTGAVRCSGRHGLGAPPAGGHLDPHRPRAFCQDQIAGFKVQKFRMREAAIAELGLQKAADIITA